MKRLRPHLEILPSDQRALWPKLRGSADLGYVLYGGTAIALRLGHRTSVDFDFFTDRELDRGWLDRTFGFLDGAKVLQDRSDTLTVLAACEAGGVPCVKVSFFGGISFGRVGVPELTEDGVALVASSEDLLATKLKVLVEAKDYRDIAGLLASGVALERGLSAARSLFGSAFQPSESLKALVWFQGGDLAELAARDRDTLIAAVRGVGRLGAVGIVSARLGVDADAWTEHQGSGDHFGG